MPARKRRRVSQTPSARTLRSATAYFRLARKADIAGVSDNGAFANAVRLQELGYRQRAAEQKREAERAEWLKTHKPMRLKPREDDPNGQAQA